MLSLNDVLTLRTAKGSYHLVRVADMKSLRYSKCSYNAMRMDEFLDIYEKVYLKGEAHLAEMPPQTVPILIDSDMAVELDELQDLYSSGDVLEVAVAVVRAVKDIFHPKEGLSAVEFMFLNKSPAWKEEKGTGARKVKHGFHLHSLNITINDYMYTTLLGRIKAHLTGLRVSGAPGLSLGSTLDNVGGKPWLLYGSSKGPGKDPYLASGIITVDMETCVATIKSIPPAEYGVKYLVKRLSLSMSSALDANRQLRLVPIRDEEDLDKIAAREAYNAMDPVHLENEISADSDYGDSDEEMGMSWGSSNISPEQDEFVSKALHTVLASLEDHRADNRSEWRVVAMLVAYLSEIKKMLSTNAACEEFCTFSARCVEKYTKPAAAATFKEMVDLAKSGKLGAKYTLTMLTHFVNKDAKVRGDHVSKEVVKSLEILNLSEGEMAKRLRNNAHLLVRHTDEIANILAQLRRLRSNVRRRTHAADIIRVALTIIDKSRFARDPEAVEAVCRGICMDRLLKRITAEECRKFVAEVFKFAGNGDDDKAIDDTITEYTEYACDKVMKGDGSEEMVTIGYLVGLAALDGPSEDSALLTEAFPEFPRTVFETPLAESIKRWLPMEVCSHDDPTRWYEFDTTTWSQTNEFKHKIRKLAQVWFFERAQLTAVLTAERQYTSPVNISAISGNQSKILDTGDTGTMYKFFNTPRFANMVDRTFDTVCRADPMGKGLMMDANKHLLAFRNVTFDYNIRGVRPGRSSDFLSRHLNADYIEEKDLDPVRVALIEDFFEKIHPRGDKREYFLNSLANIFSGSNPWKQYMVWTGTGNNGKSVCVKLLEKMLGPDLSWKLAKSLIMTSRDTRSGPSPEMVRLRGTRMAFTDEVTQADWLDCGMIKLLSGNDSIACRDLYSKSDRILMLDPAFLPVIVCNELPILNKPDQAAWERLRVFEFESTFSSDVPDTLKKIEHGMSKANRNFVFPKDNSICDRLYEPETVSTFASMLLHRFIRNIDNDALCCQVPRCVRVGEIKFTMSQNLVYKTLSKKFQLRSPFDNFVTSKDDDVEEQVVIDFAADGFADTVGLDEIVALINIAYPREENHVSKIKDMTYSLACAYKPYLLWKDDVLHGVKRIGCSE